MFVKTEIFIAHIQNNPILYDSNHVDYNNIENKNKVWKELSAKIGGSIIENKIKWKMLCDEYVGHIRTNSTDSWRWTVHMAPFRPYLIASNNERPQLVSLTPSPGRGRHIIMKLASESSSEENYESSDGKVDEKDDENDNEKTPVKISDIITAQLKMNCKKLYRPPPPPYPQQKKAVAELPDLALLMRENSIEYNSSSSSSTTNSDTAADTEGVTTTQSSSTCCLQHLSANEHIFLGHAKTVGTFSLQRQVALRKKIADLVHAEEQEHCKKKDFYNTNNRHNGGHSHKKSSI